MAQGILEQVRLTLREANIIKTDKEFCEVWLGKSECYLRSLRFTDTAPSADALANCASRLAWAANGLRERDAVKHLYWIERLNALRLDCYLAMDEHAKRKWQRKGVAV